MVELCGAGVGGTLNGGAIGGWDHVHFDTIHSSTHVKAEAAVASSLTRYFFKVFQRRHSPTVQCPTDRTVWSTCIRRIYASG